MFRPMSFFVSMIFMTGAASAAPTQIAKQSCTVASTMINVKTGRKLPSAMTDSTMKVLAIGWTDADVQYLASLGTIGGGTSTIPSFTIDKIQTIKSGLPSDQFSEKHVRKAFSYLNGSFQVKSYNDSFLYTDVSSTSSRRTTLSSDDLKAPDELTTKSKNGDVVHSVSKTLGPDVARNGYRQTSATTVCDTQATTLDALPASGFNANVRKRLSLFDNAQNAVVAARLELGECLQAPSSDQCVALQKKSAQALAARDLAWSNFMRPSDFILPVKPRPPVHHGRGSAGSGGSSSSSGSRSGSSSNDDSSSDSSSSGSDSSSPSDAGHHESQRCQFQPNTPGCPSYCEFNPNDEHCTNPGSSRCEFQPNTPGCPSYCEFNPNDEHCTNAGSSRCEFQPNTPGCPTFCEFNPMDEHCIN